MDELIMLQGNKCLIGPESDCSGLISMCATYDVL